MTLRSIIRTMPPPRPFAAPAPRTAPLPRRLFARWWRRQSPAQQDRFATLGPLISVLLFLAARTLRQPVYTRPFTDTYGMPVIQVQIPLIDRSAFSGTLVAEYSVEALLRYFVPAEVSNRHAVSMIDGQEQVLASTVTPMP